MGRVVTIGMTYTEKKLNVILGIVVLVADRFAKFMNNGVVHLLNSLVQVIYS